MLSTYAADIVYFRRLFQSPENGNFWGLESWKWEFLGEALVIKYLVHVQE